MTASVLNQVKKECHLVRQDITENVSTVMIYLIK